MLLVQQSNRVLPVWTVDPSVSTVTFSVRYLSISRVRGRFTRLEGIVRCDPNNLAGGWAEISIDPASIDTGIPERDQSLRERRFLETPLFPHCTYRARRLVSCDGNRYRLVGDLSLHGVKRDVPLDVRLERPQIGRDGRRRLRFDATGRVDRKLFGVDWNPLFDRVPIFIGHSVDIRVALEVVEGRAA